MIKLQLKYLSFFFGLISILSFFNIIYSYYLNLYLNLNTYYFSLIISLLISILFFKLKINEKKQSIFDKILTVLLGYILIPLILCIPFYFSIYNLTLLNSYFETVSGFTSTGFTIFENIKNIDQSLILWRSSTQWIGGLYFLFSIIFLIDIYDENFKKTLTNFISFDSSEVLKQALKIFFLYSGLTLLIFLILNFFSIRSFNSLNLAFTLISSGGFLPVNDLSSILKDNTQIIVLSILSSGLRFIKIYSLLKYSLNQILSFSRPKNVFTNKLIFTKINFDFLEINKYFLTILIFIMSLFILTILLTINGIGFESSFKLSILTLMNTVNSSIYGLNDFDFNNLNSFIKYCLIIFMIIGRIELLTILLLFKKFLFKN